MSVRRFERLDFKHGDLARPQTTQDGYWRLEGKVARTGIQTYRDGNGSTHNEMRFPDDVKASLPGFSLTPLTNGHPPALVTPENAKQYVAGAIGEASYEDGWIKAPITVWTKDAIEAIRAGRAQLSVGYSCELIDEPGVHEGIHYDCRQTNIRVNHVALVDAARAGTDARLRLDAGDAATADFFVSEETGVVLDEITRTAAQRETSHMPIKFKIDAFEIEVADTNVQSIIERVISGARKDAEDKLGVVKADLAVRESALQLAEKSLADMKAKFDELDGKTKADAAKTKDCPDCEGSGKIDGKACDSCGGEGTVKADAFLDSAKLDALINRIAARRADARADLIAKAREVLGTNAKFDGKTLLDIKREVVGKLNPKLTLDAAASAEFVQGAFTSVMAGRAAAPAAIDLVRTTQTDIAPRADEKPADPQSARAAMLERNRSAFASKK